MQITSTLPFDHVDETGEFWHPEAVAQVGAALERAGFAAGCVTDHPVPTARWLDGGGHHAQDPFIMLSFLAAVTTTLRLQTGILVLPYRNPFIVARSVSTLDVFSGGRVTLGVGTGYLKGEYGALGVDFEQRNELTDEYLHALKAAWASDDFTFEGSGYAASGNRILPRPVQQPHPPLLIGGNSRRAMRRAVELGDAWNPFITASGISAVARTAALSEGDSLADGIRYVREYSEKIGRDVPPEIVLTGVTSPEEPLDAPALLTSIEQFDELGISSIGVQTGGRTLAEWCDNAEQLGVEVIAQLA